MATISEAFAIALEHHRAGRLAMAGEIYRRILAVEPGHADSLHLLGVLAHQSGKHQAAVELIGAAIAVAPGVTWYHSNRGEAYRALGKLPEALACFRRASELAADNPDAWNGEGLVLKEQGQAAEAMACFQRAIELKPEYAEACSNLGAAFLARGEIDEAIALGQRAVQLNPNLGEGFVNLGIALHARRRAGEATAAFRRAVELLPASAEAHSFLGVALRESGDLDEAVACHRRAIELKPDFVSAHNNLGVTLKERGELDEALACYRRAVELGPQQADFHSNLLYTLHFCAGCDARTIYNEHAAWNRRHAEPLAAAIPAHGNDRSPGRRLRVGYVSPDLKSHPVGRFMLPLLENHDHRDFEIICYSSVHAPDGLTDRCRAAADVWRDVAGLSNEQLAGAVRADAVDVLVDLSMHMSGNRLLLFARKPAPVQVTYLAYCSTTGLSTIDYRLTDPYIDPPGSDESVYSERSVRLPETYWCYVPPEVAPPVAGPPSSATGQVTFGSLNNFCKATPPALEAWCRLLDAVSGSQLLLHARPGSHRRRVQTFFAERGVDPERVRFAAAAPMTEYLRLYEQIDVALDPFPYGGGTTSCDALWMGVPVVSLCGATGVGRGGRSILSNLGLGELIAGDVDDYVRIAAQLALDPARLARLRVELRERMRSSPLMDAPRFARSVEAAYRRMWRQWCEG